ncbi:MAG: multisubunit Na+/H+ antiporter, MnhG subunit [Burkholderiaceae bacterium]|nr:multisubunit Na+/H+ antiporter, MnhG subunit [Burkholderiaceae bacterium]
MTVLLGWGVCSLAMLVLLIAAVGILRLPDALSRQHAATKAGTLAVSLFAVGLALAVGESAWIWRLLALVAILLTTLPLASHALARAGVVERERSEKAASRLPGD